MIDRDAIRSYDEFVWSLKPCKLPTRDLRTGLFGRARVIEITESEHSFNEEYDVIVAGGGPSGVLYGSMLAKRGYSVLLLEKNSVLGAGVTWNLAHDEFEGLAKTNVFTEDELNELIIGDYDEGVFRLFDDTGAEPTLRDYYFNEICNISIDEAKYFEFLTRNSTAQIRFGCLGELKCVTDKHAYVKCSGESEDIARCRLFIDARGWTSPLTTLVHPKRQMESVFNVVGLNTHGLERELGESGKPIGFIGATYEGEIPTTAGVVQPILSRFSTHIKATDEDVDRDAEVLYYFTRTNRPTELAPLVEDMMCKLPQIAEGLTNDKIRMTYFGHIPGYVPAAPFSPWGTQISAGDRTLLVGCAGMQFNGLTGCAFGAMARNAVNIGEAIDRALKTDKLSFRCLRKIDIDSRERSSQAIAGLFAGAMELASFEKPGTVNRDWQLFMNAGDSIDAVGKNEAFRDKIRMKTLNQLIKVCARDIQLLAALLRNNRGRIGTVVWTFVTSYLKLFVYECRLLIKRRRYMYLWGVIGGVLGAPWQILNSILMLERGSRVDYRKMSTRKR